MNKEIKINNFNYKVLEMQKDSLDIDVLKEKVTDYFDNFDYIVGDWAYGKLRLKGFYKSNNKKCKPYNDYSGVKDYLKKYCAFGCGYFILEKIKVENKN